MLHRKHLVTVLLFGIVAGLVGCARDEDPKGVIPEGYKQSMEKARDVEQQLQEAADKRLEALDPGE